MKFNYVMFVVVGINRLQDTDIRRNFSISPIVLRLRLPVFIIYGFSRCERLFRSWCNDKPLRFSGVTLYRKYNEALRPCVPLYVIDNDDRRRIDRLSDHVYICDITHIRTAILLCMDFGISSPN